MVTPGEAATTKVEPSLLKPAARTSSVPVMVNGSRCPASCSAAMAPARINSRQPWPVRFGSRPPAMPQTSINSPATGPMPNAGRSSWIEPVALLVPVTDNYRAGGHLDNPSALVADNQEEVGHGREADLRKAAHGHVPNPLPPRNHPMIMPEVRHWPASSSAVVSHAEERAPTRRRRLVPPGRACVNAVKPFAGWAQPNHRARVARQLVVGPAAFDPVCRVRAVSHEGHVRTGVPLVRSDDVAPPTVALNRVLLNRVLLRWRSAEPRAAPRTAAWGWSGGRRSARRPVRWTSPGSRSSRPRRPTP